jgi:hypothetical protein
VACGSAARSRQGRRVRGGDGDAAADDVRPGGLARFPGVLDAQPRRGHYQDIADAFAGHPVGNLTRDEVLDNITFAWLTNTGVSSARLYWENTVGFLDAKGVSVPAAVSTFAHEIYKVPRSWAERAYPNLIYFNELDRGNHFAAWQEPALFAAELRAGSGHCASRTYACPLSRRDPGSLSRASRPAGAPGRLQRTARICHDRTLAGTSARRPPSMTPRRGRPGSCSSRWCQR